VKELLDKNRLPELEKSLLLSVIPAINLMNQLQKQGKSYMEAHEAALESLIPKDGREFSDNPPEPLSLDDQEKVYRKLERRQEIMGLLSELRSKRP